VRVLNETESKRTAKSHKANTMDGPAAVSVSMTHMKMEQTRSALSSRDNEEINLLHKESKEDPVVTVASIGKQKEETTMASRRGTFSTCESGRAGTAPPPRPKARGKMAKPEKETIAGSMGPAVDPVEQELFEKRLCEDADGLAVKKINQNGKTSLRYVRSVTMEELDANFKSSRSSTWSTSSRSVNSSWRKNKTKEQRQRPTPLGKDKRNRVLIWGKKKDTHFPIERFVAVRKGKTTTRARRNSSHKSLVLSLITNDPLRPALDIEAPTKMDRDKFARAFARYLEVPLMEEDSSVQSLPDVGEKKMETEPKEGIPPLPPGPPAPFNRSEGSDLRMPGSNQSSQRSASQFDSSSGRPVVSVVEGGTDGEEMLDDGQASDVSSITQHGYDQEIVEELHMALNEMRAELEESRAEASRAVKVAEQAIQSAERSNSAEWQNTVTHKAAEAAALAQKRSAEAMAKQRIAEERLASERRTAAFWKKQAQISEEEAGSLQTRAAAAEVQRAAIEEQLASLRLTATAQQEVLRDKILVAEAKKGGTPEATLERTRKAEQELNRTRLELFKLQQEIDGRKKKTAEPTLSKGINLTDDPAELLMKVHTEAHMVREELETFKQTTINEMSRLPAETKLWAEQIMEALKASQTETERTRRRLACEMSSRRKLQHRVQDLNGMVRVYCRPRNTDSTSVISLSSQETVMLQRTNRNGSSIPMSFEFDRVFDPVSTQHDIYNEIGDVCLGVLDGYNICVMTYGQTGAGKTNTLLGDVGYSADLECATLIKNHGIQLQAMQELFSISESRKDRFKDTFSLSILEVFNERLTDMVASTNAGETRGEIIMADKPSGHKGRRNHQQQVGDDASSGKQLKLEIRSDLHGETVVQGLTRVEVESFQDAYGILCASLQNRRRRLVEMDVDIPHYEAASHVIATLKVVSTNIATGLGCVGKIQFVDLAGSDLTARGAGASKSSPTKDVMAMQNNGEWKFANRSIETLGEVVAARLDFHRSIPYRNSTLTHLLSDSLDHDTKVLLIACVSSDPEDSHQTESTLRFASRLRRVNIGTATKHTLSPP
jgi:hypothetical protein